MTRHEDNSTGSGKPPTSPIGGKTPPRGIDVIESGISAMRVTLPRSSSPRRKRPVTRPRWRR